MKNNAKKLATVIMTIPLVLQSIGPTVYATTLNGGAVETEGGSDLLQPDMYEASEIFVEMEKITFDETDFQLFIGDKVTITPIFEPENVTDITVLWETSDESVAIVDEFGVVSAVGVGIATISASNDEGIIATARVTVQEAQQESIPLSVPVTNFSFSKTEHTMKVGSELELKYFATIKPYNATTKDLIYTSSDETIATVNNKGEVISHQEGVVEITGVTVDGGFSATATVYVTGVQAESVRISKERTMLAVGMSETLHTEFSPENTTNKSMMWESSNEAVVTVDEYGVMKGNETGVAYITGTAVDGGVTGTIEVEVVEAIDYTIDNPYDTVDWETVRQLKADLHAHTNETDGKQTLQEQINIHQDLKYDILGMTDHDNLVNPFDTVKYPGLEINDTLEIIKGNEYSGLVHHMNGFFLETAPFVLQMLNQQVALDDLAAQGGIGHINHPGRYYAEDATVYTFEWYQEILRKNDFLVGVEVINRADRYSGDRQLWDRMLTEMIDERNIWGFANSDAHRDEDVDTSYNMMLIDGEYSEEKMRTAMEQGTFYFTAKKTAENNKQNDPAVEPPVIDEIIVDNTEDKLTVIGENIDSVEWVSSNSRVIGNGSTIDLDEVDAAMPYVRAVIKNAGGVTFTQPFKVYAQAELNPADESPADEGFGPSGDVTPSIESDTPNLETGENDDDGLEDNSSTQTTTKPESELTNTGDIYQATLIGGGIITAFTGVYLWLRKKHKPVMK